MKKGSAGGEGRAAFSLKVLSVCAMVLRWGPLRLEPSRIPTGQRSPRMLTPAPGTSDSVASGGGHSQAGGPSGVSLWVGMVLGVWG